MQSSEGRIGSGSDAGKSRAWEGLCLGQSYVYMIRGEN